MCESKKEKDIKLIERCVTEKWNLRAMGCYHSKKDEVDSCPLCVEYWSVPKRCSGCPVREKTGKPFCNGSPFEDWANATWKREEISFVEQEIEFLISLLPEDHPWRNI